MINICIIATIVIYLVGMMQMLIISDYPSLSSPHWEYIVYFTTKTRIPASFSGNSGA